MTTEIQKVYDSRARVVTQMQELVTTAAKEGRAMSAEENEKFDRAEADERAHTATIEAHRKLEEANARAASTIFAGDPNPNWVQTTTNKDEVREREHREAFKNYLVRGIGQLTPEERQLLETRGTNTQVIGTDSLGGYSVPKEWQPGVEAAMLDYSGIMQAADIVRTATGRVLYFLTEDDTSTAALLVAESGSFTVQDVTQAQIQMDAYKYGSIVKESWELMQDSAYNWEGSLQEKFATRFGRAMNASCTTGDGSSKPNGVVTATSAGKVAASATAITFQEVIDLKHSIDPSYRNSPKFGFMFHDTVLAYLKKLSLGSGDARPLWQPSYREGEPDTIDGTRYWINQGMDSSINASSKLILCGDFSKYKIRIAQDMQMQRLNELYAVNGQVGFQAWMRWDGELLNTSAIKHLITAAS